MDSRNGTDDLFEDKRKLPGMLNVLTILTFIGCGLSYIGSLYTFFGEGNYDEQMLTLERARDEAPAGVLREMAEASMEMFQRTYEYRYVLLGVGLVCTTLCLIGALQMRKLRKSGFPIYVVGEITPLIVSVFVIGFGSLIGSFGLMVQAIIALLFIVLYGMQRRYLVK